MAHQRRIIYLASFLFSIPVAITTYINSSFLETYLSTEKVSLVYILASLVTILGLFILPRMLNALGNRKVSLCLALITLVSFLFLAFSETIFLVVLSFIIYFAAMNFLYMSLDIFIEDFSKNKAIGRFRGFYLMVINSAWVIAQMISGSIITKSSYEGIYLFAAGFMILVASIFVLFLHDFKDPQYKKISVLRTLRFFMERKNVLNIYVINFILKFFFAWMIIYTPIYLHEHLMLGWDKIGFIFTIMLLPFLILEFPLGKLSDKIGEKKMLTWGFAIAAIFTFIIPFVDFPSVWLLAIILFMTRVGAATIEIMSETYFFKSVAEENVSVISFFRNTSALSFIIAPLIAIPILLYVPHFENIFFILAAILMLGLVLSLRLKDVR